MLQAKVLLICNDPISFAKYNQCLVKLGHRMISAGEGFDARSKFSKERFDLVIRDMGQTKGNAPDTLNDDLLDEPLNKACPLIVIADVVEALEVILRFESEPRVQCLDKPTDPEVLTQAISKALSKTSAPNRVPSIDVRFVNPILEAAIRAISLQEIQVTKNGPLYVKKPNEPSGDLSVVVGVTSAGFRGSISLSFLEQGYLRLLEKMFKISATEISPDNRDAVVELLNQILEEANQKLAQDNLSIQTAEPTIFHGKGHSVGHSSNHPTVVLLFDSKELTQFRVEICAQ